MNQDSGQIISNTEEVDPPPAILHTHFSAEEDAKLVRLQQQQLDWSQISNEFGNRSARQCRERFQNYLDPDLNTSDWTPAEDELLLRKESEMGKKWKEMIPFFQNRSNVNIKNRFATLQNRKKANEKLAEKTKAQLNYSQSATVLPYPLYSLNQTADNVQQKYYQTNQQFSQFFYQYPYQYPTNSMNQNYVNQHLIRSSFPTQMPSSSPIFTSNQYLPAQNPELQLKPLKKDANFKTVTSFANFPENQSTKPIHKISEETIDNTNDLNNSLILKTNLKQTNENINIVDEIFGDDQDIQYLWYNIDNGLDSSKWIFQNDC